MCPFMAYLRLLNNCSHTGDCMDIYRKLKTGLVWDLQSCFYEIMTLIFKKKKTREREPKRSYRMCAAVILLLERAEMSSSFDVVMHHNLNHDIEFHSEPVTVSFRLGKKKK